MPKKILFESAKHHILTAARQIVAETTADTAAAERLHSKINAWTFKHEGGKKLLVQWDQPTACEIKIDFSAAKFYTRGDLDQTDTANAGNNQDGEQEITDKNRAVFRRLAAELLQRTAAHSRMD